MSPLSSSTSNISMLKFEYEQNAQTVEESLKRSDNIRNEI